MLKRGYYVSVCYVMSKLKGGRWLTRVAEVHPEVGGVVYHGRRNGTEDLVLVGFSGGYHNIAQLQNVAVSLGLLPVPKWRRNRTGTS